MSLIIEKKSTTTIISIDRPTVRNAIDAETAATLRQAFADFDGDANQSVAVLTGTQGTFCAGYDLKSLARMEKPLSDAPRDAGPMGPTRATLSKPVIAAVEGAAVAGGLELALWCDLRVVARSAYFGVYCRRCGVPLIDGGTVRLPRLIGHSRAMDMILTGRRVAAQEAADWGLANRLVADGDALDAALGLAAEIARFPQVCLRSDRQSALDQWGLSHEDALRNEATLGQRPLTTEARSGAQRFAGGKGRGGDFQSL